MRAKNLKIFFTLIGLLLVVILLGISKGSVNIPLNSLLLSENRPILYLRIFRVFMAVLSGCGLAVSGIVLQAILRNPLAEPYILGTSSGAGIGAVLVMILGVSFAYLPLAAFCGALLSIILVYNLARQHNKINEHSLILSGVIVSIALSSLIVFLISISTREALHGITWWLWGSLQVYDHKLLILVSSIVFLGIGAIYLFCQDLNAISLGDEEALHLGIDIELVKKILILISSLITAGLVCISGIIGFVGLIIPHIMRMVVGPNHKILIPASCFGAAVFMVVCDILSRSIAPPFEIPIGVITALVGAPAFIILLKKKQRV
ncbi:MAG: iron ABC transporter permease [Candidatus Omnitrophota bacterium]|nr:iron ABC transporter permease [Candidatus Omnitrophota bacterium]MBU1929646.1 iron ABC transporter permease [Candidatus Omnitrophota bacterium]MBU2035398.1 iron ABC transporter permease [Candidatus Omnitrophota bacterium]MBU2221262.1 iron ABC transporter permease [Candidatus Omnitrophota bacterium]MBU2258146.1 iron ABC transporter permease [Candidatus Omnitrophota bacterium]